jgi:hypothetical protein
MLVSKDKEVNLSTRGNASFKEMGFEHQFIEWVRNAAIWYACH